MWTSGTLLTTAQTTRRVRLRRLGLDRDALEDKREAAVADGQQYAYCYPSSMSAMKLSVSLPEDDVATLDEYARNAGLTSRSAALQHAVALLRTAGLERDYDSSGARDAWEDTTEDGLSEADAAR